MSACWGPDCPHESHKGEKIKPVASGEVLKKSDFVSNLNTKVRTPEQVFNKMWGNRPKGLAYRKMRNKFLGKKI